jgi:cytosine/adenosine deaminase-related metal-dependent hydrolase
VLDLDICGLADQQVDRPRYRIAAVGTLPADQVSACDVVIDADRTIAIPGLIEGHGSSRAITSCIRSSSDGAVP